MSKLIRKAEVRPTINFPILDGETLEEACDRFFNHLDDFCCFYTNSYHEEYTVDENGNEIGGDKKCII